MTSIDWSKPIELYNKTSGETYADAEVLASDLKGNFPYVVRWAVPTVQDEERVSACSESGGLLWYQWIVRNKPVVHHKWVVAAMTKTGNLVLATRDTKESAYDLQSLYMSTGKYAVCNVFELEWTEE